MEPNISSSKIIDKLFWWGLVAVAVIFPFVLDNHLINFLNVSKQALLGTAVFVGIVAAVLKSLLTRSVRFTYSAADVLVGIFLIVVGLSTMVSLTPYDSFLGHSEVFLFNFLFLLALVGWYFATLHTVNNKERWQAIFRAITIVGGVTGLGILISAFLPNRALDTVFLGGLWNTIDASRSSVGIWFVSILIFSTVSLFKNPQSIGTTLLNLSVSVVSFLTLVVVGFTSLWVLLALALLFVFSIGSWLRTSVKKGWLALVAAYSILAVVLIFVGPPKFVAQKLASEITLNTSASMQLAAASITSSFKNATVGSGPGTFGLVFSKFRTADFNLDSAAWNLRFSRPRSTAVALLIEGGIISVLALVVYIVLLARVISGRWLRSVKMASRFSAFQKGFGAADGIDWSMCAAGVAWLALTIGGTFLFYGPILWWLWATLAALLWRAADSMNLPILETKVWQKEASPVLHIICSIVAMLVAAGAIWIVVWGYGVYRAERAYGMALRGSNYVESLQNLSLAVTSRPRVPQYQRAASQILLLQAGALAKTTSTPPQQVGAVLAAAVNAARQATLIAPNDVANWENLATIYENAAVLVPEVREQVVTVFNRIHELEPTNPIVLWRLGNTYAILKQNDKARASYEQAIALKRNYGEAYVSLATLYEQENNFDKAIATFEPLLALAGDNVQVVYNYGRLLYNRNKDDDRAKAEKVWKALVQAQPNFSNGLYSLGLLYQTRGDTANALVYYKRVRDLNPDNQDVISKINSLTTSVPASTELPTSTPAKKP